jgi:hypothetical protein
VVALRAFTPNNYQSKPALKNEKQHATYRMKHNQRDYRAEIQSPDWWNNTAENIEVRISNLAQGFNYRVIRVNRNPAHQNSDEYQH